MPMYLVNVLKKKKKENQPKQFLMDVRNCTTLLLSDVVIKYIFIYKSYYQLC